MTDAKPSEGYPEDIRKDYLRLQELLEELSFRRLANQLTPKGGEYPNRWALAAQLCKYVGLQPNSYRRMSHDELMPFIRLAIEEKTGKPPVEEANPPTAPVPSVVLQSPGESVFVKGIEKKRLTDPQYNVVQALLAAGGDGLSKDELPIKSGHADAVKILKRVAKIDADWADVILLAERSGGGYRIKGPY